MENIKRYFRPTISHPEGWHCHDGDCYISSTDVCTCGLLHELQRVNQPAKYLADYYAQRARQESRYDQMLRTPNPFKVATEEQVSSAMKLFELMMSGKIFGTKSV